MTDFTTDHVTTDLIDSIYDSMLGEAAHATFEAYAEHGLRCIVELLPPLVGETDPDLTTWWIQVAEVRESDGETHIKINLEIDEPLPRNANSVTKNLHSLAVAIARIGQQAYQAPTRPLPTDPWAAREPDGTR